ncbi:hypothetical protein RM550_01035 [Streptomyces sp. DSM 41527]|uniref:Uncharacterized protein n=1 Tax=Streptomyces mooreae TaxID=3075523 RepID=A0ABU2SZA1_9ACTN|nr:hypothetical protein [Streptomyces sp. DSM 41527]MDT0454322.1 hypothetical protein [Streptomyces sp. DSM 41527]
MTSYDDLEPQHDQAGDVLLNTQLVRPYAIAGVTYVPASEAVKPCPFPCDCCKGAGRQ